MYKKKVIYIATILVLLLIVGIIVFLSIRNNKDNVIDREWNKFIGMSPDLSVDDILEKGLVDVDVTSPLSEKNIYIESFINATKWHNWYVLKTVSDTDEGPLISMFVYDDRTLNIRSFQYFVKKQGAFNAGVSFSSINYEKTEDITTLYLHADEELYKNSEFGAPEDTLLCKYLNNN